ncbi:MAG: hypothetical protein IJZ87_09375 [Bacteroidales bacterium]|nr:hypothetical protein [Bacteroidales bacterium]
MKRLFLESQNFRISKLQKLGDLVSLAKSQSIAKMTCQDSALLCDSASC